MLTGSQTNKHHHITYRILHELHLHHEFRVHIDFTPETEGTGIAFSEHGAAVAEFAEDGDVDWFGEGGGGRGGGCVGRRVRLRVRVGVGGFVGEDGEDGEGFGLPDCADCGEAVWGD